jgi:hypothetical protein
MSRFPITIMLWTFILEISKKRNRPTTLAGRGNIVRQTYHGVNDEPFLLKDSYHAWEATYDERGQQSEKVYIGLDGKPVGVKPGCERRVVVI